MVCSRPDAAYGVGVVSKFMGNPGKELLSGYSNILIRLLIMVFYLEGKIIS